MFSLSQLRIQTEILTKNLANFKKYGGVNNEKL